MNDIAIRRLSADDIGAELPQLGALLAACVADGASLGFLMPFTVGEGADYFSSVAAQAKAGMAALLVAEAGGQIVGTVHLGFPAQPNQRHRADLRKLLVAPQLRGRGVATALMDAVEALAQETGRSLLCLDTATGSDADHLYRRRGWTAFGIVPDYAAYPDGRLGDCTFFWKRLTA